MRGRYGLAMRCISRLLNSDSDEKHRSLFRKVSGTVAGTSNESARNIGGGFSVRADVRNGIVSLGDIVVFENQRASKAVKPFQHAFTGTGRPA